MKKHDHVFVAAPIKDGCDGCCYDIHDRPCQFPGRPGCYGRTDGKSGIYKKTKREKAWNKCRAAIKAAKGEK